MPRGAPWPTVSLRVEPDVWARLLLMARERDTSASKMVRALLRAELGRWETPARLRDRAKITEEEVR
jgi:hypothetical protein